jgi:cytochrome P450
MSSAGDGVARSEEVDADPYAFFARLRREDPLHLDADGLYRLTRYEDVVGALRDERLTSNDERWQRSAPFTEEFLGGFESPAAQARREWFLYRDGPDHRRLRAAVAPAFTPRATAAYRPAIQLAVDHVLDSLDGATEADLLAAAIVPLPAMALASTLGFPQEEWRQCVTWVRWVNLNFARRRKPEEVEGMNGAVEELGAYLAEKISRPDRPDLFSALVRQGRAGGLTDDELVSTLMIVLVAGQHVMVRHLGACVIHLLAVSSEEERDAIRRDPARLSGFVDEMLRWDPPSQGVKRVALEDVSIGGHCIPHDAVVVLSLASANRDETVFANPDAFDPERCAPSAIPFSVGAHFCLGAYFAKLEAEVFLEALLNRFPGIAFAGEPPALPVARRGVPALNVVWDRPV